jgi:hypothetical protein
LATNFVCGNEFIKLIFKTIAIFLPKICLNCPKW